MYTLKKPKQFNLPHYNMLNFACNNSRSRNTPYVVSSENNSNATVMDLNFIVNVY